MSLQMLFNLLAILTVISALGVSLCVLLGALSRFWWRFDLFTHFRVQYIVLLGLAVVVLILLGKWMWAVIFFGLVLILVGQLIPFYWPRRPQSQTGRKPYRLFVANVLQENQHYHQLIGQIEKNDPDLIVLIETGEHWIEALSSFKETYPYFVNEFWGEENYDIALFSRIPVDSFDVIHLGPFGVPTLIGNLTLDNQPLTLIATHPAPPKSEPENEARNAQLVQLAEFVSRQTGAVILAGDLNISSWSPFFTDLLKRSGLSDSRLGRGVQPSWPVDSPWLRIPIDHVLSSPEVQVLQRYLGLQIGSDHLPVVMEFYLLDKSTPTA